MTGNEDTHVLSFSVCTHISDIYMPVDSMMRTVSFFPGRTIHGYGLHINVSSVTWAGNDIYYKCFQPNDLHHPVKIDPYLTSDFLIYINSLFIYLLFFQFSHAEHY